MTNAKSLMTITVPQLQEGNIAHFYGARFEIVTVRHAVEHTDYTEENPIITARGVWLDGASQGAYFGPGIDWTFQGNANAMVMIEDCEQWEEQPDSYDYDKYN